MRTVWSLWYSLDKARKPTEETTLWIQRVADAQESQYWKPYIDSH
jgi:hypothetical protein